MESECCFLFSRYCSVWSVLVTTATMSASPSLNVDARDLRLRGNSPMSKKGQRLGLAVLGFRLVGFVCMDTQRPIR